MIGRFPKKEKRKILRAAKQRQVSEQKSPPIIKSNSQVESNPKVRI